MSTTSEDTEAPLLPSKEAGDELAWRRERHPGFWARLGSSRLLLLAVLLLSLTGNALQGGYISTLRRPPRSSVVNFSDATVDIPFPPESDWGFVDNMTRTDELWGSLAAYVNKGFVALPKDEVDAPPSDSFPWDASKEVYVLNSFHLLHCLDIMYKTFRALQQGELVEAMYAHTVHCLDAFRQEVLCTADDTLYVLNGDLIQENRAAGITQLRTCRNWQELEDFAVANSACFHNFEDDDPRHLTIEEWVYCPDQSPYQALAEESALGGR